MSKTENLKKAIKGYQQFIEMTTNLDHIINGVPERRQSDRKKIQFARRQLNATMIKLNAL
jgi:hypothetical protein